MRRLLGPRFCDLLAISHVTQHFSVHLLHRTVSSQRDGLASAHSCIELKAKGKQNAGCNTTMTDNLQFMHRNHVTDATLIIKNEFLLFD